MGQRANNSQGSHLSSQMGSIIFFPSSFLSFSFPIFLSFFRVLRSNEASSCSSPSLYLTAELGWHCHPKSRAIGNTSYVERCLLLPNASPREFASIAFMWY